MPSLSISVDQDFSTVKSKNCENKKAHHCFPEHDFPAHVLTRATRG
jgi:hypothetical protein